MGAHSKKYSVLFNLLCNIICKIEMYVTSSRSVSILKFKFHLDPTLANPAYIFRWPSRSKLINHFTRLYSIYTFHSTILIYRKRILIFKRNLLINVFNNNISSRIHISKITLVMQSIYVSVISYSVLNNFALFFIKITERQI